MKSLTMIVISCCLLLRFALSFFLFGNEFFCVAKEKHKQQIVSDVCNIKYGCC